VKVYFKMKVSPMAQIMKINQIIKTKTFEASKVDLTKSRKMKMLLYEYFGDQCVHGINVLP
jgi:hypothetical protein